MKITNSASALLPLAVAVTANASPTAKIESRAVTNSSACADVHLFLARGTTENYPGMLGSLATLVIDQNNSTGINVNYQNIFYPAQDETASDSYFLGRTAVTSQLQSYADDCPDARIFLLGYSQGAMVVGDALAGGGGNSTLGNATAPFISKELGERLSAIVLYGNPRHSPNHTYNVEDAASNAQTGKYPRLQEQIDILDARYGDIIHDYCNTGDGVCSSGDDLSLHVAYATDYDTEAAAWLQTVIEA